jgi:hypothetical protein
LQLTAEPRKRIALELLVRADHASVLAKSDAPRTNRAERK